MNTPLHGEFFSYIHGLQRRHPPIARPFCPFRRYPLDTRTFCSVITSVPPVNSFLGDPSLGLFLQTLFWPSGDKHSNMVPVFSANSSPPIYSDCLSANRISLCRLVPQRSTPCNCNLTSDLLLIARSHHTLDPLSACVLIEREDFIFNHRNLRLRSSLQIDVSLLHHPIDTPILYRILSTIHCSLVGSPQSPSMEYCWNGTLSNYHHIATFHKNLRPLWKSRLHFGFLHSPLVMTNYDTGTLAFLSTSMIHD